MIDTHSHLFDTEFDTDRESVIEHAKNAGIQRIYMPNVDVTTIESLRRTAETYSDFCFPMMGFHPTSVHEDYKKQLNIIEKELGKHSYYAIGEIGIDLYWDQNYLKEQIDAFRVQIKWAKQLHLPIIIHSRCSFSTILSILQKEWEEGMSGIFHCFGGTVEEALQILAFEKIKLGIGGILTFKKSTLPNVLKQISLDSIVIETDAPYLAPVPFRGKRNEPSYLLKTAEKLAEIYNVSFLEIEKRTTHNALLLFE